MKRPFLAIFLFLLLAVQLVPAKVVSDILSKQRIVSEEEVHHNHSYIDTEKDSDLKKFWYLHYGLLSEAIRSREKITYIIMDEALFKVHHLEVPTQPPNLV